MEKDYLVFSTHDRTRAEAIVEAIRLSYTLDIGASQVDLCVVGDDFNVLLYKVTPHLRVRISEFIKGVNFGINLQRGGYFN